MNHSTIYSKLNKPKTLLEVCKFLHSIPNIRYGGCGIAALATYRWLKLNEQLSSGTRFVYMYTDREDRNETKARLGRNSLGSCGHVILEHNGKRYDDGGTLLRIPRGFDATLKIWNEQYVVNSLNTGSWNSDFNRWNIKKIESVLGIDLSDINKTLRHD